MSTCARSRSRAGHRDENGVRRQPELMDGQHHGLEAVMIRDAKSAFWSKQPPGRAEHVHRARANQALEENEPGAVVVQ